uniref:Cytochrome P450, family 2, subfamily AE, polypeptide 1 n=1 Tax=Sinocyclocheilus grahami TaxID=75366 RepID=A0A672NQ82_SINGR
MNIMGLLIFLCVLLLVKHLRDVLTNNMPPGPFPLPLIGSVLNIGFTDPLGSFQRIAERYGDVSTLYLGNNPCSLLTGYESFKEAFVEQADIFTDRKGKGTDAEKAILHLTYSNILNITLHFDPKICPLSWTHVASPRQQRRFALATLKYFGVGKKTLENSIPQECRFLCDSIQTERGQRKCLIVFHHLVTDAVTNIICGLVFGHRFEYDDHKFHLMQEYLDDVFQLSISNWGRLYNQFPTLMSMLPGKHQTAFANMSKLKPFLQEEILKHKEERDPSNPRDYIDCYLDEIEKDSEAEFTETNLIYCVVDLFGAGTETTSKTLRWALLFMVKYPEVQKKVQPEIDQVIGQTRQPLMDDRTNLPYTYAVLHEIQRFANIITFTPPRMANKDTTVGRRLISKVILFLRYVPYSICVDKQGQLCAWLLQGVKVLPLLKSILQDKNEYSTPYEFNPAHFLDENDKFLKKDKNLIPFSIGKRMCPGEQLARMELFLFFISLDSLHFTFLPPEGETLSLKRTVAIASAPEPFHIHAVPR